MLKFLTAKWENLVMANYAIEPALLTGLLPTGTELDLYEDKCYVSLVAFMFRDTRVLGFHIPFHVDFEEINLRFYVKREIDGEVRRGVVFIKELVPKFAIAFVARTLYGEPYEAVSMRHDESRNRHAYSFMLGRREHAIEAETGDSLGVPDEASEGSFIIEHYWGYTKRGSQRTDEYKVEHPKWELFPVVNCGINIDFRQTYGSHFAFLTDRRPDSVLFAKGSEIAVYKGKPIR
jgi:uncharacterized protein YqjF (DUF2071 family)